MGRMASVATDRARKAKDAPVRMRPPELEDPLNKYVYHPLAAHIARLLTPTPVTPNAVSVTGGLMVWVAAFAYTQVAGPLGVVLGLFFHCLWHVLDGADGDLARLTGKASPFGEMVDGACDYAAHSLLYVALAAVLDDRIGIWAWIWGLAAAASHSLQTNHAETQRRSYLWWAYGLPWLKHSKVAGQEAARPRGRLGAAFGWLGRRYLAVADSMAPWTSDIDRMVEEAAGDPIRQRRIRRLVRLSWKTPILLEKVVGPNPRTIILGLGMALGSPAYFFFAETVLLNLLLAGSVLYHNAAGRRLAARLRA